MQGTVFFRKFYAAIFVVLIVFLPQAKAQKRYTTKSGLDLKRLEKIPARMKSLVEQGRIAGAVTLVARHGRVVSLEAVGYRDLETREPIRKDTIFDIRSMTKPITAIAVMILMEDGKLALNDPIEKYLPEFKLSARNTQGSPDSITIRHLLTHTSGLPFYRLPESEEIPIKRDRTLFDFVNFLSKQRLEPEFKPGTQHRYNSRGFAILGRIIEAVSGKPYEQFVKERIFDPLGMKNSFFFIPTEKQSRIASVYRLQNGKLNKWEELMDFRLKAEYPGPEFGMYSTASDLASLCQMMLDGGTFKGKRILSKMSVEMMTENQTTDIKSAITGRTVYQGLGWSLSGDPINDFPLVSTGSFGHNGAFGTIFWIDPKKSLIRIFLIQLFGFGNESDIFMAMAASAVTN